MQFKLTTLVALVMVFSNAAWSAEQPTALLIFSKTQDYRHKSIEFGAEVIKQLAESKGYRADHSEDASLFSADNLKKYSAVIFLNTTGELLDHSQQAAFEKYIQAGGGFVGIHAATDAEYDWPWYGQLIGAYFDSHPKTQAATLIVAQPDHPAVAHLADVSEPFRIIDEWYNFHSISAHIKPLLLLDESSYEGGTNGDYHPASWYQEFDGGRAFYTVLGHRDETFSNPLFIRHLEAGIDYAVGL